MTRGLWAGAVVENVVNSVKPRSRRALLFVGDAALTGPAIAAFAAVAKRMGLPWDARAALPDADLTGADRVIVVGDAVVPALGESPERWPGPTFDADVAGLVARLLGGSVSPTTPPTPETPTPTPKAKQPATVKVGRETKGRRGSGVTVVWDVPLAEEGLRELAATLKQRCGTGGTVKDGRIEIQGDQRERLSAELEKLGYRVKRVGG